MFSISRFEQLLKFLPRGQFDRLVAQHQANKHAKRLHRWDQLIAMVYAQLAGACSLRTLEAGFNAHSTHHYHLGVGPLHRSTLAQANAQRSPEVLADLARLLMAQAQRGVRRSCQELLYALDSTSITLTGPGFDPWTRSTRTRHTQGIKLHVLYQTQDHLPCWHSMSAPNVNDVQEGRNVPIERGALYIFDKGYCDYNCWHEFAQSGARFVTRFKRNAALQKVQARPVPGDQSQVLCDQIVRFKHKSAGHTRGSNCYQQGLRRIEVARQGLAPLVLATNDLNSPAQHIAQHYRDRWQVELFFKWIKQHLNIKRFLGRSENAVKTQILTALIAYLLLALYAQAHAVTTSLWMVLAQVRATLFQRPVLEAGVYRRRRQRLAEFAAIQPGLF